MFRLKTKNIVTDYILKNNESFYRLAYSYVRNVEDALDIVQESILKALSSLDKLENHEHVRTWFYRILVNTSLDLLRKQKKVDLVDQEAVMHSSGLDDDYPNFDLQRSLDDLPSNYRSVIVLRYFEDLKIEDVASILNENVNTIKTRLYTALKMLRLELED